MAALRALKDSLGPEVSYAPRLSPVLPPPNSQGAKGVGVSGGYFSTLTSPLGPVDNRPLRTSLALGASAFACATLGAFWGTATAGPTLAQSAIANTSLRTLFASGSILTILGALPLLLLVLSDLKRARIGAWALCVGAVLIHALASLTDAISVTRESLLAHPLYQAPGAILLIVLGMHLLDRLAEAKSQPTLNAANPSLQRVARLHVPDDGGLDGVRWNEFHERREIVSADALRRDDLIELAEGEVVPADATILLGYCALEQMPFSGATNLRYCAKGDDIFAGTVIKKGSLRARVRNSVDDSVGFDFWERRSDLFNSFDDDKRRWEIVTTSLALSIALIGVLALFRPVPMNQPGWVDLSARLVAVWLCSGILNVIRWVPLVRICAAHALCEQGVVVRSAEVFDRMSQLSSLHIPPQLPSDFITVPSSRFELLDQRFERSAVIAVFWSLVSSYDDPLARTLTSIVEAELSLAVLPSVGERRRFELTNFVGMVEGREVSVGTESFLIRRGIQFEVELSQERLETGGSILYLAFQDSPIAKIVFSSADLAEEGELEKELFLQGKEFYKDSPSADQVLFTCLGSSGEGELRSESVALLGRFFDPLRRELGDEAVTFFIPSLSSVTQYLRTTTLASKTVRHLLWGGCCGGGILVAAAFTDILSPALCGLAAILYLTIALSWFKRTRGQIPRLRRND